MYYPNADLLGFGIVSKLEEIAPQNSSLVLLT